MEALHGVIIWNLVFPLLPVCPLRAERRLDLKDAQTVFFVMQLPVQRGGQPRAVSLIENVKLVVIYPLFWVLGGEQISECDFHAFSPVDCCVSHNLSRSDKTNLALP